MNTREGMENNDPPSYSSASIGIAGRAAAYGQDMKDLVTKNQDVLLISKYRRDYENAIINVSDLVDNLMLEQTLTIDTNNPYEGLEKLNILYNSKQSLNETMKFVDKSK